MRTATLLTAFGAAVAVFNEFTPHLELYPGAGCNTSAIVLDGNQGCSAQSVGGSTVYVQSNGCDFDNNVFGVSLCRDSQCTNCISLDQLSQQAPLSVAFDQCGPIAIPGVSASYKASCSAAPCCQTSAIVVCFAVFLSLGAGGLCVFWVYMDRVHKQKADKEAKEMAASVEEETRKAKSVGGGLFGGGAAVGAGTGGYSAL